MNRRRRPPELRISSGVFRDVDLAPRLRPASCGSTPVKRAASGMCGPGRSGSPVFGTPATRSGCGPPFDSPTALDFKGGPPVPQDVKLGQSSDHAHHIDAQSGDALGCAAKLRSVTGLQEALLERRNRNGRGFQLGKDFPKPFHLAGRQAEDQIQIAAKLRCAVQYAGLPSHDQGSHRPALDRRKGFGYRVRGQASLPAEGRCSKEPCFAASALVGTEGTILAIPGESFPPSRTEDAKTSD